MARFFNTSGPCKPEQHYMISVEERLLSLRSQMVAHIEKAQYFILHAPRQTGKTTAMLALSCELTAAGQMIGLYINIEAAQASRNNVEAVNKTIISEIENRAKLQLPETLRPSEACFQVRFWENGLKTFLNNWCAELAKPLILFIDEIDALIGDGLLSVLRQLRSGYNDRPEAFPQSICLIGVRDIRDYRIYSDALKKYVVGGSAFNIKEASLTLSDFTQKQIEQLYQQHTAATGQQFDPTMAELVFQKTLGQPWLVNALGRELCTGEDPIAKGETVDAKHLETAVARLIKRRDVHLDQLADKLTEPRVAQVIQKILIGAEAPDSYSDEDQQYLIDLGLCRRGEHGLEIANPIYKEIVPRVLTAANEQMLGQNPKAYVTPSGHLDIEKLLSALIQFYKRHHHMITQRKTYNEAAHHLVFLAWLHRIVNSGGSIEREYAVGLGRMDLHISYAGESFAMELKLLTPQALDEGKKQLAFYLERLGLKSGYLILFQRNADTQESDIGKRELHQQDAYLINVIYL